MKPLLICLAILVTSHAARAASANSERKFKVDAYELTTETVRGERARNIFRVLAKAGFPVAVEGNSSLLVTSAINCIYHDPERDDHWITENCWAGESAALQEDSAHKIAPKIVKVASFPNEKEVIATLPGGYITSDMGRGIMSWEKVDCEMSATAVCEVTYRSDYF